MQKSQVITLLILICFPIILFCQKESVKKEIKYNTATFPSFTIEQFLDTLHTVYQYNLSYSSEYFPKDSVIKVNFTKDNIQSILDNIFKNYSLDIDIKDDIIIIRPHTIPQSYITIQGTVLDYTTNQPLPCATISVKNEPLGTITNSNGKFSFLVPKKYKSSKLYISSLGYQSAELPIPPQDTTICIITKQISIPINEIKIIYMPAEEIIKRVRNNITDNYYETPKLLSAFFREKTKKDNTYIEISEAFLNIYKDGYHKNSKEEKVKFIVGRKNVSDKKITVARLKIEGGPALFAKIDIAKNMDFISEDASLKYQYKLIDKAIELDRLFYIIRFTPIDESDKEGIYYSGELHIDAETYAIVYASFQLTKHTLKRANKYLIKKEVSKIRTIPTLAKYEIFYRPLGSKWILSRTNGILNIKMIDKRNKRIKTQYETISELLITNSINTSSIPFKNKETFKSTYILADKITEYDPDFWKNYNIIKPEDDLIKVFKNNPIEIYIIPPREKTRH